MRMLYNKLSKRLADTVSTSIFGYLIELIIRNVESVTEMARIRFESPFWTHDVYYIKLAMLEYHIEQADLPCGRASEVSSSSVIGGSMGRTDSKRSLSQAELQRYTEKEDEEDYDELFGKPLDSSTFQFLYISSVVALLSVSLQ